MLSSKRKEGAIALYMILFTPIVLMLFSVMLDGILTKNIRSTVQRHLDVSSLAIVTAARDDLCVINQSHIDIGSALFQQNMNNMGRGITYSISPIRNLALEQVGVVNLIVSAKANNLIADMFIP